ncbi:MAG: UvrB/UvrC motif-containing protein, partial [Alphaproteobacteria bacterium]|nr:UvrB/UvrC motif-containing protein [Alphaproteobacteria bacterium]
NTEHGIIPKTISKSVFEEVKEKEEKTDKVQKFVYNKSGVWDAASLRKEIAALTKRMRKAAENLEFEKAASLRDAVHKLEDDLLLVE